MKKGSYKKTKKRILAMIGILLTGLFLAGIQVRENHAEETIYVSQRIKLEQTLKSSAPTSTYNYEIKLVVGQKLDLSNLYYEEIHTDAYYWSATDVTGSLFQTIYENIIDHNGNAHKNPQRFFYKASKQPVALEITAASGSYFYIDNETITGISSSNKGIQTGEIGQNKGYINGWYVNMNKYGSSFTISRESLPNTQYPYTTTLKIYVTATNPNIVYSDINREDVFAGSHTTSSVVNQGGSNDNVYLIDNATIGSHPAKGNQTSYYYIRQKIKAYNSIISMITSFFYAFCILTSFMVIVFNVIKLASSSSHPFMRREAIVNLIISGACISLLGGITLFTNLILSITLGP